MNSKYVKNLTTYITLTLIIASVFVGISTIIQPVKAQGTITLSSENLHPWKVVEIIVNIPGLDADSIDLRITKATGEPLALTYKGGTGASSDEKGGFLKAAKIAVGVFVAYLGGDSVDLASNPAYPKKVITATIGTTTVTTNIARISTLDAGSTINIEVLGYGITKSLIYSAVKPASISLVRSEVPSRRTNAYEVVITLEDQDLNLDPTKVDVLSPSYPIVVYVTWISGTTGNTYTKTVTFSSSEIKESAVNSGKFTISPRVDDLRPTDPGTGQPITPQKGDTILLNVYSNINWGSDSGKYLTARLDVVYRYPEVSVSFTQQAVTITITSPDDNVDPYAKDNLDPTTSVTISYYGTDYFIPTNKFVETGANTGVFTYTLTVARWDTLTWGTTTAIDTSADTIILPKDVKSFSISAKYLDISGSATYTTVSPTINVIKASPVKVVLNISDKDLNIDPDSVEYLTATLTSDSKTIQFKLKGVGEVVYEVSIRDSTGNPVTLPSGYANNVNFFETDFDSGVFTLSLPSVVVIQNVEHVVFAPGKSYFIDIIDHTGKYSTTVSVTITPIKIELDRTTYPINRDKPVVIHVTYYNDKLNIDPTRKDSVSEGVLKFKVTDVKDTTITSGNVGTLTETGPDTGIFVGTITLSAGTPQWIDAKIVVYLSEDASVYATATFKPYQLAATDISVDVDKVNLTGCFVVTINDPDANVDSEDIDTVSIDVIGPKGTLSKTAYETDVNTGVFKYKFCAITSVAGPGDTITIKYIEKTPVLAPTTTSFEGSEYPITTTVKVMSYTGELVLPKDWIGPYEIMSIQVKDPDLNANSQIAEKYEGGATPVKVVIEGVPQTFTIDIIETGINTGVFKGKINLPYLIAQALGKSVDALTAEDLGKFIGRSVTIVYLDSTDASGARATVIKTLTIKAVDAEIIVDKESVNLGDTLKITIKNADIAQNPRPEFRRVFIRSTTYPTGITLYALEVEPGVYEVSVKVVSLAEWVVGAPQIPAKLGDKIDIAYEDPIAADGTTKTFMKSVGVGVYAAMPGKTEKTAFLDPVTGAPITPTKGKEMFLSVTLKNVDIVEHSMTVIVVVRDPNGVAVGRFAATVTLGAGASTEVSWSWTPIVAGSHTIEVYIVKSLADRTPIGETYTTTVSVSS